MEPSVPVSAMTWPDRFGHVVARTVIAWFSSLPRIPLLLAFGLFLADQLLLPNAFVSGVFAVWFTQRPKAAALHALALLLLYPVLHSTDMEHYVGLLTVLWNFF